MSFPANPPQRLTPAQFRALRQLAEEGSPHLHDQLCTSAGVTGQTLNGLWRRGLINRAEASTMVDGKVECCWVWWLRGAGREAWRRHDERENPGT